MHVNFLPPLNVHSCSRRRKTYKTHPLIHFAALDKYMKKKRRSYKGHSQKHIIRKPQSSFKA